MNKTKVISGIALSAFAPLALSLGGAMAATTEEITLFYTQDDSTKSCRYVGADAMVSTVCEATYGTYDSGTRTLTLKGGVNALVDAQIIGNVGGLTITSNEDITIANAIQNPGIVFDFGEHSLTTNEVSLYHPDVDTKDVTIKSGSYNIKKAITCTNYEMSGGNVELITGLMADGKTTISAGNLVAGFIDTKNYEMLGGTVNIGSQLKSNSAVIKGGDITADNMYLKGYEMLGGTVNLASGLQLDGNMIMKNGTINIKTNDGSTFVGFGISLQDGRDMTIEGGNINIDGFEWGISGDRNNKLYFNGGTTIIKNAKVHSIWLLRSADPENSIIFGSNVGMKEDTYVFWESTERGDLSNDTGVAAANGVTIAEGYTNQRKHYGWEEIEGDHNEDVVVSDAPINNKENPDTSYDGVLPYAIIIAITMVALGACGKKFLDRH